MLLAKDFRKIARDALKGKWVLAVLVCLIAGLLGANPVFTGSDSGVNFNTEEETAVALESGAFSEAFWLILIPIVIGIVTAALIYLIIVLVIGGAVTLGYCKFNLALVDRKEPQFADLFSGFNRFGAGFCVQFLRGLYIFLWSLLFVIPGIIASYRYAMSAYILAEHPEMTASEAIETSKKMMVGNKWRLFCLEFSFIGWSILCAFTFGIGNLILRPYREAAYAAFYREISGTWEVRNKETGEDFQQEEPRVYYQEV